MVESNKVIDFLLRMLIGSVIGVLLGWGLSELSYNFNPNSQDAQRAPQRIDLVIPYGTAEQVKAGVGNPALPSSLSLVQGDILVVKNEDTVAHQIGPLFIPPETSSVLNLGGVDHYTYSCSFTPGKYMGLDVLPRAQAGVRFEGILAIGLPTGMMLALYSYMLPGKKKAAASQDQA